MSPNHESRDQAHGEHLSELDRKGQLVLAGLSLSAVAD